APTAAEQAAFAGQTDSITARGNLLITLVTSPEIITKNPSLIAQHFVTAAYVGLWNKSPDANFAKNVSTTSDPAGMGRRFINDAHYIGPGTTRQWIIGLWEGMLGRNPGPDEYRTTRQLILGNASVPTDQAVFELLFNSSEFKSRP